MVITSYFLGIIKFVLPCFLLGTISESLNSNSKFVWLFLEEKPNVVKANCFTQTLKFVIQVAKAIQSLLLVPRAKAHKSIRREFKVMEKKKLAIDNKVDTMVRHELWGGLGFMMVQTMAFMRLTFWELSWDVMEPICFYLTSMYCMACYTFFLRTSKEPSFEGFYQARFSSKQKRLMKLHNFDIEKYNQLRAACSPTTMPPKFDPSIALPFDNSSIHQWYWRWCGDWPNMKIKMIWQALNNINHFSFTSE